LAAYARHLRRPVEDRHEIGVQAGAAADGAALCEEEDARLEACAEALWACGELGLDTDASWGLRKDLGVVPAEKIEERVWFGHCGVVVHGRVGW
jgi:hypothetical protein